ncbi:ComEC/Rec2 family competence protein [Corynebacterium poyangense]|uniref:ComEC/Rec2 family competence protein n=1 Tax=Corynebacterium poyangense TaxID=2684405 RepID=A0A7H0SQE4_9CORY|nr:ComEC/Rec2 family competence protein [Corynebacterium poyangense]MBZ8178348.1 ComEC/Rec2 family competence protein [Corynebacterium poyangense]QNQ90769.1 ComEC/Rec2 family competence protein [Corynebacterium poyangense]
MPRSPRIFGYNTMREFRLIPAALLVWMLTAMTLLDTPRWIIFALVVTVSALAIFFRSPGHLIFDTGLGCVAWALAELKIHLAHNYSFPGQLLAQLTHPPQALDHGGWLLRVSVPRYPAEVTLICRNQNLSPEALPGSYISAPVSLGPSHRPGIAEVLLTAPHCDVTAPVQGIQRWAALAREEFRQAVLMTVGPDAQGLIPGMVVGDTSLQDAAETQLYITTGLSHLSAVSGANVAIVTTAMVLLLRAVGQGPVLQSIAAFMGLVVFLALVGTEPSVLRATVTGLVGLLAVVRSAYMEPMHALSLSVLGLVLWDPDLSLSYGFALSVAATAGIVMLSPLLVHKLSFLRLPHILTNAVAVALAADVVTMPIIALMAGKVSLVSVLANLLVTAVVPIITVLGLAAALLAQLPGSLEYPLLKIIEPCAWWIHHVASWCQSFPYATVAVPDGILGPAWVIVGYGWILYALMNWIPQSWRRRAGKAMAP